MNVEGRWFKPIPRHVRTPSSVAERRVDGHGCRGFDPHGVRESKNVLSSFGTIMSSIIVEIRSAEGGADAKLLVIEQTKIYIRLAGRRSL